MIAKAPRIGLYKVERPKIEPWTSSSTLAFSARRRSKGRWYAAACLAGEAGLRKSTFEIPADFRIEEVLHGAFGAHVGDPANARPVVIEFFAEKTELVVGRVWHRTQELKRVAGGRTRLSFTCTNLMPVVSWILQWGPHARVIEPTELAATIIDELDRARAQYAAP